MNYVVSVVEVKSISPLNTSRTLKSPHRSFISNLGVWVSKEDLILYACENEVEISILRLSLSEWIIFLERVWFYS